MPELSRFFGIVITVFYKDHALPHIHVRYGKHHENAEHATVEIATGELLAGRLPRQVLESVRKWLALHREAVAEAWREAAAGHIPQKIEPLPESRRRRSADDSKGPSRRDMVYGSQPYAALRLVEWLEGNLVRLFFSTGLIKEVRLPTKSARKAKIVFDGLGLDIDGKGLEMSAPRLASMRGRTMRKADC